MSDNRILNVLFLCSANSARSIMAECILNRVGNGHFRAYSAGVTPADAVHPEALKLLAGLGYDVSGLRAKSWTEFTGPDAPKFDFVFTVCDDAAQEECPVFPGEPWQRMSAHWGIPDPKSVHGDAKDVAFAFADAYKLLNRRISIFAALPLRSLDRLALQQHLDTIGQSVHDEAHPAA
ncbi:arsenate reductase ArsC [Xanthobacter autotrophicus]|uniref:arsenate reductase ArsC n=1 Tax=Xanthobacter autotrophicus TaxID=280 RepID=UPI0037283968